MQSQIKRFFRSRLLAWYQRNNRPLPWRKSNNPYRIWVSEVMLQQTQVNTVIPYYHNFLKRFPNLNRLARSDLQDVLKVWEGMGYYARARNLHRAAQVVVRDFGGTIPDTWNDFRKLPGVGDYIAAAVLSIVFSLPYAVVDGNVKRVLSRLLKINEPVNTAGSEKHFKIAAADLLDQDHPGMFNQAMMELGALICRPRDPACEGCPLQKMCQAYRTDTVAEYPKRLKRRSTPRYQIAVGVVFKNSRVLITRRKTKGLLGGLWEFPGGKIKANETAENACVREIKEEVNIDVAVDRHLTQVKHAYTHFKITMDVFCCRYLSGRVKLNGPVDHRWIRLQQIDDFPVPKANHKFIPKLMQFV
ncbi:MAG: A/G-specific adenine glycosylase [Desulfobacterales bacterium]|jgi:A/G-specific adenine glycosylase